jgi:signal transduction histidine kinase
MASVIDSQRIPIVRKLSERLAKLSLRGRIAGTMVLLVAISGIMLGIWAHLADYRLKRSITFNLLSEELTHFEKRMRNDRGAEPLRSNAINIYPSTDFSELPRRIAQLQPGQMHRIRSAGGLLDVLVRDGEFGRLYITYDVTDHALQERNSVLLVSLGVLAIVGIAAWAAFAISSRLVKPVHLLAEHLTHIDPGQRHVRIGAQFATNELEPIARSIDAFMQRLDGFVEREQSFTSTASHELRTPLAVIRGAVELLEVQLGERHGSGKALVRIQRAVREMSEFTDALLILSREERAGVPPDAGCDVGELLVRAAEDQRSVLPGKRIALEMPDSEGLHVAAPASMVAMVIGNVVRNALQHGTGDSVVCRITGRELRVTNPGALPQTDLGAMPPRRFTTHPGGHGMGLYLVRRICERYRWAIRLENTAEGVRVTVGF